MRAFVFWFGFVIGVGLAFFVVNRDTEPESHVVHLHHIRHSPSQYERWYKSQGWRRSRLSADELRYGQGPKPRTEADELYETISVTCVVSTSNPRRTKALTDTWARSCNRLLLYDGRKSKNKSSSSFLALCSAARRVQSDLDWALFVTDDTFAIPENLRRLVAHYNSSDGYYLGHSVEFWGVDYNVAAAGFALSRGALGALSKAFPDDNTCATGGKYWKQEDYYLGKHLHKLGIHPIDTRDEYNNTLFLGFDLDKMMFPNSVRHFSNYFTRAKYPVKCCSYRTISFQVLSYTEMYKYYYMIYTMQIFSEGSQGNRPAPTVEPEESVWKSFVRERGLSLNLTAKEYERSWYVKFENATVFPGMESKNYENDFQANRLLKDFNLTNMPDVLAGMLLNYSSYKL